MRATLELWVGGGVLAATGPILTRPHRHYATQLTLAPEGGVALTVGEAGGWQDVRGVNYVPSGQVHALRADGPQPWGLLFVDPDTPWGRVLAEQPALSSLAGSATAAQQAAHELLASCRRVSSPASAKASAEALLAALLPEGLPHRPERLDPRARSALSLIEEQLGERPTLSQIAKGTHLSPGRLRHLLVAETGLGFRAQVRWRRLRRAWTMLTSGSSVSRAAHESGFSDAAHLTRITRATCGLNPGEVLRGLRG